MRLQTGMKIRHGGKMKVRWISGTVMVIRGDQGSIEDPTMHDLSLLLYILYRYIDIQIPS